MSAPLARRCLALLAGLALASAAKAGPITSITIDDCDDQGCEGTSLSLSVEDNMDGTFTVVQSIDSTGFNEIRLGMNQVGFEAIEGWSAVDLVRAPTAGWLDPPAEAVTASNSLCQVGTDSDKVCTHGFIDITTDGVYSWEFLVTGGTLLGDWHWGGQFADQAGPTQGKIVSAEIVIPEPGAAVVFGIGTILVGSAARRRGC